MKNLTLLHHISKSVEYNQYSCVTEVRKDCRTQLDDGFIRWNTLYIKRKPEEIVIERLTGDFFHRRKFINFISFAFISLFISSKFIFSKYRYVELGVSSFRYFVSR